VKVSSGLLADEAATLNRDFNWSIVRRRPWVVAKIALSLDGKITTPPDDDRWLTSPEARRAAHELRWESDAILIGAETARRDNPQLTVRLPSQPRGKIQPRRIVLTRSGKLPRTLHLFTDRHRDRTQIFRRQSLADVLGALGAQQITHVLIEGGGRVLTEAFREGLVNEVAFFIAPALMGTVPRALYDLGAEVKLREVSYRRIGPDLLCRGFI
jgi:diaminohydroxyphosphoribosylaminopyrimidine deaminase/5-amino-6-(5-phosphoribosylamino)uracil reductase